MKSEPDENGRHGFDRWWFASAAVLLLIAVVFVVILVISHGEATHTPPASSGSAPIPTSASSSAAASAADGGCTLADGDQGIQVSRPSATWRSDGYFQYPTSSRYGPVPRSKSDEWGCFQHSPTGALFAAAYFVDGAEYRSLHPFIAQAAIPGAAADSWMAAQSDPSPAAQGPTTVPQIAGFQFRSVQSDAVTVSIALVLGDYDPNGVTIALRWDAGQSTWLVDLRNTTRTAPERIELQTYTPWSAR
jgi:hypothetical protein